VERCVNGSADSLNFNVLLEQPRVLELWQIVTVMYFVSFDEDRNCDGKKLQGHGQQIVQHMQGASQRLHAVSPSTRGYNGIQFTQGILEDMDIVWNRSSSIDFYLIDSQSLNLSA
jgi:hypothetical protein